MSDKKLDTEAISKLSLSEKKVHARELFFGYAKATEISRRLNIKLPTLKTWIYGYNNSSDAGWKVERETAKVQLVKDLSADKRGMVYNMVNGSLYLIHDFVESAKKAAVEKGESIDIKTAEKLTSILMNLHKIVQDENDGAEHADYTPPTDEKELKARLEKADPFGDDIIETTAVNPDEEVL